MEGTTRSTELEALARSGSEHYAGLETFPNPGVSHVALRSDELSAVCLKLYLALPQRGALL